MPRDGSPARMRLRAAALELYREHGFDQTTTAQIAQRAGVTERTYFRHFADKREVLFDGEDELRALMVGAVAGAPEDESAMQWVVRALTAAVPLLVVNRAEALQRAEVIAVTPSLQERAHAKTASLIAALTESLVARGHPWDASRLTTQVGMAAFEYASSRWGGKSATELTNLIVDAVNTVSSLGAQ